MWLTAETSLQQRTMAQKGTLVLRIVMRNMILVSKKILSFTSLISQELLALGQGLNTK